MAITVRDDPAAGRYEIYVDEQLAGFSAYTLDGDGRIAFTHTELDPAFRGRGLGPRLVAGQLDDARRRGLAVLPLCPYVRRVIVENAAE